MGLTRYCVFLIYLWLLLAIPLAASTVRICVANYADTTVDCIDPMTNKVVQVIDGFEVPHGIAFSPDGKRIYVSDEGSEAVLDVVDQKTGKIINKVPLSGIPNNIAITQDGGRVLVCIREVPGAVDVVDTTSLKVVKSIPVNGGLHNDYVTPDGKYVVAGNRPGHIINVIDLQSEELAWKLNIDAGPGHDIGPYGPGPMAIEAGADGSTRRIFVQCCDLNGFVVVDFAKRQEVARIKLPDEPVWPESPGAGTSHGIGISPDGKTLWANNARTRSVNVYSLPELKLMGHALTGKGPEWLTFTPDGKMIYVSNSGEDSVSAIDTTTLKEVARIPVGKEPGRIKTLVLP